MPRALAPVETKLDRRSCRHRRHSCSSSPVSCSLGHLAGARCLLARHTCPRRCILVVSCCCYSILLLPVGLTLFVVGRRNCLPVMPARCGHHGWRGEVGMHSGRAIGTLTRAACSGETLKVRARETNEQNNARSPMKLRKWRFSTCLPSACAKRTAHAFPSACPEACLECMPLLRAPNESCLSASNRCVNQLKPGAANFGAMGNSMGLSGCRESGNCAKPREQHTLGAEGATAPPPLQPAWLAERLRQRPRTSPTSVSHGARRPPQSMPRHGQASNPPRTWHATLPQAISKPARRLLHSPKMTSVSKRTSSSTRPHAPALR